MVGVLKAFCMKHIQEQHLLDVTEAKTWLVAHHRLYQRNSLWGIQRYS